MFPCIVVQIEERAYPIQRAGEHRGLAFVIGCGNSGKVQASANLDAQVVARVLEKARKLFFVLLCRSVDGVSGISE